MTKVKQIRFDQCDAFGYDFKINICASTNTIAGSGITYGHLIYDIPTGYWMTWTGGKFSDPESGLKEEVILSVPYYPDRNKSIDRITEQLSNWYPGEIILRP